jgi:hypothetical protein
MRCGDAHPGVRGILAADSIPERMGIIKIAMRETAKVIALKRRIQDVKLAVRAEIGQRVPDQLRKAGEVSDSGGDDDDIKGQVLQYI